MVFDYLAGGIKGETSDNMFKAFLNSGMVNVPDSLFGDTSLHIAFQNKRYEALIDLIKANGDTTQVKI